MMQDVSPHLAFVGPLLRALQASTDPAEAVSWLLRQLVDRGGAALVRLTLWDGEGEAHHLEERGDAAAASAAERWFARAWTDLRASVEQAPAVYVVRGEGGRARVSPWQELGGPAAEEARVVAVPVLAPGQVLGTVQAAPLSALSQEEGVLALQAVVAAAVPWVMAWRSREEEAARSLQDADARRAAGPPPSSGHVVGTSRPMRDVWTLVEQVSGSDTTVLLRGESGTGKELVAEAIHRASPRSGQSFVRVNCAALPESIIESELFGHERGAFTGAVQRRLGRFEQAQGGTIFLDEIGELSVGVQVRLLRVLQERTFERVGGNETLRVNVRVIAATNRDLEAAMEQGVFRPDLYYRLNVFPIALPALRERRPDILLLADHFVGKYASRHGKRVGRLSTGAIDALVRYHWPGNVRELENCIERAVLLAEGDVVYERHLPPTLQVASRRSAGAGTDLKARLGDFERELLADALAIHHDNMAAAARYLGISERVMHLRAHHYGMGRRREGNYRGRPR